MTGKTGKKIKIKVSVTVLILVIAFLFTWRIWNVNHSQLIQKYMADEKVYQAGSDISLPDAVYYWDVAELYGYHMRVTGTEIMSTDSFLSQYDMTLEELEELCADTGTSFDDYRLIYLITAEFWNTKWDEESEAAILLDNFILTGLDFYILPATNSINRIDGVNPELGGGSAFSIGSDRVFEVVIPYLVNTESEIAISLDYLLDSEAKLLITLYPEESYLMLPSPVVVGNM